MVPRRVGAQRAAQPVGRSRRGRACRAAARGLGAAEPRLGEARATVGIVGERRSGGVDPRPAHTSRVDLDGRASAARCVLDECREPELQRRRARGRRPSTGRRRARRRTAPRCARCRGARAAASPAGAAAGSCTAPGRRWRRGRARRRSRAARATSPSVVHGVNGRNEGRTSMPCSRRSATARALRRPRCGPCRAVSRMASLTDSNAETTNRQPDAASSGQTSAWRRTCSTLTVQSKVRSGNALVHRAHDAQRVVRRR